MAWINYKVGAHYSLGGAKMVEVMVELEGPEGPTAEKHELQWHESERYKVDTSGKRVPKTGTDFKADIEDFLNDYYSPKGDSPSP